MTSRKDFQQGHAGYEFRKFKCSGSCGTVVEALAHSQLWCNQPGCRGSMKPSYPVAANRLANDQFEAAHRRNQTPRSTPLFSPLFRSQTPRNVAEGPDTPDGAFEGLIQGINQVEDLLLEAFTEGTAAEIRWARPISRDTDE